MRPTSTTRSSRRIAAASAVALALAVAACGGDSDDTDDAGGSATTAAPVDTADAATVPTEPATEPTEGTDATEATDAGSTDAPEGGVSAEKLAELEAEVAAAAEMPAVRAAGTGVLRGRSGREEDLLDARRELAHRLRQHGPMGRRDRQVDRHGRVVLLPERRWPGRLAGGHATGHQRGLRRRRPRVRDRSQCTDSADGRGPRAWASRSSTCTSPTCRSRPIR